MTDIIPIAMSAQPAVYRAELILSIAANHSHKYTISQSSGCRLATKGEKHFFWFEFDFTK